MQTGRNWTRRSIEELIDDYLRRHAAPPSSGGLQFMGSLEGKIANSLFGSAEVHVGVEANRTNANILTRNYDTYATEIAVFIDCNYGMSTPINLQYHSENTYFPISGFIVPDGELKCIYYLPWSIGPTYLSKGYRITKATTSLLEPEIGGSDYNTFTGDFRPSTIHSIPSSQYMVTTALAFVRGRYNELVPTYQAIDTLITGSILPNITPKTGLMIMANRNITHAEITAAYPQVTSFDDLTY